MSSVVDICNLALSHLGDTATVSSIDPPEGSAQAEHCARFYPMARNTILEAHPWSFATTRKALVELSSPEPPASWAYIYGYPNLCIRPLLLLQPETTDETTGEDFIVEETEGGVRVIYTNIENATLRYIFEQADPGRYSQLFVNALARLLASYLAGPVIKGTEGARVGAAHLKLYEEVDLPRAKAADSMGRQKALYDKFQPAALKARV